MADNKIDNNDIVLDLGDSVYSGESYELSSSALDTITLDPSWNTMGTITIPTTSTTSFTGSSYTITGSNGYTYNNLGINSTTPNVMITSGGMEIKEGDIVIGERSLTKFMEKMEQRLSILVPDPEKLEKFEALKKAYEHYKTMEALCFPFKEDKQE